MPGIGAPDDDAVDKIAIAGVFHDLGIWTDGTFDYLPPSVRLAVAYLSGSGRESWTQEITDAILSHHKIVATSAPGIAEPFRRADWIDVTRGLRTFGLSRVVINEVFAAWPSAGLPPPPGRVVLPAPADAPAFAASDVAAVERSRQSAVGSHRSVGTSRHRQFPSNSLQT